MNLDLKNHDEEAANKSGSGKKFYDYNWELLDGASLTDRSSKPTHHRSIYNKTIGSIDQNPKNSKPQKIQLAKFTNDPFTAQNAS